MSLDQEVIELFVSEAKELLEKAQEILNRGELSREDLNELFRVFHTIKGNAGMIGLSELAEACHRVEDLLQKARDGVVQLGKDSIDKLLVVVHRMGEVLNAIAENRSIDLSELRKAIGTLLEGSDTHHVAEQRSTEINDLASILKSLETPTKTNEVQSSLGEPVLSEDDRRRIAEAIARGLHVYRVHLSFSVEPVMMMFRYFQTLQRFSEFGEVVKIWPENIENIRTTELIAYVAVKKLEDLEEALKEIPDLASYSYTKIRPDDVGISISDIEEARRKVEGGEVLDVDSIVKRVEELVEGGGRRESEQRIDEIRVDVKSLDELFNLVGELVLIKSRLYALTQQIDSPQLKELLTTFSRLVSDLQDQVMRLRLIPLHHFFRTLPGFVKDVASKYGKDVDVYFEGGEIAIDRKVLERIVEPMKRLLEIIVKDSIEDPKTRVKKGKPSTGAVKIVATREGNTVVITVEEDGQGLDPDEVKYRAIELGLVSSTAVDKMSCEELVMLATLPGFSLRDGRFSGLDSVRRAVESLGGSFEIHSHVDVETRYVIRIPVSMATMRALLIRLNGAIFAVPSSNIVTIVNVSSIDRIASKNMLRLHDRLVPIHDLSELLGELRTGTDGKKYALIVEKRNKQVAVLVDEVLGQEDIVVKSLGRTVRNLRGIAGATILGDGRVCLILDLVSLIP